MRTKKDLRRAQSEWDAGGMRLTRWAHDMLFDGEPMTNVVYGFMWGKLEDEPPTVRVRIPESPLVVWSDEDKRGYTAGPL